MKRQMTDLELFREGYRMGVEFDGHGMYADESFFSLFPNGEAMREETEDEKAEREDVEKAAAP